jgi:hypothetical protein
MAPSRVERWALIGGLVLALVVLALGATAVVAGGAPSKTSTDVASPSSDSSGSASGTESTPPAEGTDPSALSGNTAPGQQPAATSTLGSGAVLATGSASLPASMVPGAAGRWALDFTLPTFGKSGCLVCHGDANLVVAKGNGNVSYWIDEDAYNRSAHGRIVCTGCHIDFGYKAPHGQVGEDWRATAKQACKNCHPKEYDDISLGWHAVRPVAGQPDPKAASKPLCGDCHGGHYMPILKNNPAGQAQVHASSLQMCGRAGCHLDFWASYNDYYHGAAYKTGAGDAPACWDCHGTHNVMKSTDRQSPTNADNFGSDQSCAQPKCHTGVTSDVASYAKLIHGSQTVRQGNPLIGAISRLFGR